MKKIHQNSNGLNSFEQRLLSKHQLTMVDKFRLNIKARTVNLLSLEAIQISNHLPATQLNKPQDLNHLSSPEIYHRIAYIVKNVSQLLRTNIEVLSPILNIVSSGIIVIESEHLGELVEQESSFLGLVIVHLRLEDFWNFDESFVGVLFVYLLDSVEGVS